jgi:CBS domain-containing protein
MDVYDDLSSILDHKGHRVLSCAPETMVLEAIRSMAEHDVGALTVMQGDYLVGVVSERDYTRKVVLKERSSRTTAVREIMSTAVITAPPSCNVEEAMRLMSNHHVRHLPVVRDRRVIGMISMGDLVERIISTQRAMLTQLEGYIIGRYPG